MMKNILNGMRDGDLQELQCMGIYDDIVLMQETNADLREALEEIAKGEGTYSLDPLKHASNTIANMTRIATEAIRKAKGE